MGFYEHQDDSMARRLLMGTTPLEYRSAVVFLY
jgi:hypothetical protein